MIEDILNWLADLRAEAWATVIAVIALLLSFYNLWLVRWRERRASFEMRRLARPSTDSRMVWSTGDSLAIKNHGPARARDVEVKLLDWHEHGKKPEPGEMRDPILLPAIQVLHPLQEYYFELGANESTAKRAVLSWRDGRLRRKKITMWLSVERL